MIADPNPTTIDQAQLAVQASGVCKAYGQGTARTPVLEGVDVSVRRGECVFLAGPSGSGKTTLLSILGCILSTDRGQVRILGQDTAHLTARQRTTLRRDQLGFVFQRFHLIRGLTAVQNVCVPLTLRGIGPRKAERCGADLLETVGLADKIHSHPNKLSAGQCQRVALARALIGDPDLILADEPTASLDAKNGQQIMQLLRRLTTDEGKAAIVVTHDQRIFPFADRVLWLENGRVVDREEDLVPVPAGSDTPAVEITS